MEARQRRVARVEETAKKARFYWAIHLDDDNLEWQEIIMLKAAREFPAAAAAVEYRCALMICGIRGRG
ncbi:MAG: hypothetical protein HY231_02770 [Acidobacteria bacterium]|nr:hypothetical protein [Acidobacteriota bacterium]